MVIEIGRMAVKIAGRDAGLKCVIVDILDDNSVLIDGETRRRKCNINHLEFLEEAINIDNGASHEIIASEFEKLGLNAWNSKPKQHKEKPVQIRMKKEASASEIVKGAKESKKKDDKKSESNKKDIGTAILSENTNASAVDKDKIASTQATRTKNKSDKSKKE